MTDLSLLPPNSTALERAAALTTVRVDELPVPVSEVWNPATCPENALPWLAWGFGVEDWSAEWSEAMRRAVIDQSIPLKRHRGTIGAVQAAINTIGLNCKVREWFRQTPHGAPYTYQLLLEVDQSGFNASQLRHVLTMVERTKNLRSHLDAIYPSAITRCQQFVAASTGVGIDITVFQDA